MVDVTLIDRLLFFFLFLSLFLLFLLLHAMCNANLDHSRFRFAVE